ncbi:SDR family NAD(P)-dependent oxidoreductase [Scytonema sp. PRP1]|uniref:SDR family NAD(P)-dependent oxidoreductase n=1 Tax=Scytonema sp. PRP1 TaxID=3120513 RepID=UPI00300C9971
MNSMINREPIAIIGIGCRFPGAENPEGFWQLLHGGVDAITEVPSSRWNLETFYEQDTEKPEKMSIRWGGFLKQVDLFDPQFFAIAPREAVSIDPQQRLLLEVAWEALEDSGQIPEHLAGKPTGVFIGVSSFDYYELLIGNPSNIDAYAATGNTNCIAANRISYIFGFTGPSIAIDTACSSSLVAVHLACQSLWSGECSLALAGGVHVMLSPWVTVGFAKGGFLAPDGRCKTFDARANGYVRSEGAGMVVLKTLSQALADGDRIYAVIQGSAVNQDGRSNGLTAPNPKAQEAVLREAYFKAGVSPGQIQYIEAHGTGTKLGDPIEMKALGKVLAEGRPQGSYCKVGSVKTNIGHLEAAAGIAGLIKVALSLKHRQIPPSLHFQKPNPYIPFDKLPLRVQQTLSPWPQATGLALAGVSSFGFGGTNAHVVLAEAPLESQNSKAKSQKKEAIERQLHLLTLSAKSEKALLEMAQSYQEFLLKHPEVSLADVCFTANTGRSHFDYRLAIIAESKVQLQKELSAFTASGETNTVVSGQVKSKKRPKVAFLFTGQGSQYIGMGRQLYETAPIFKQTLDRCDEILRSYLGKSLLTVLYPEPGETSPLDQTAYTQPALFAIEYALSELWKYWGVVPTAVMGHSLGEYVAACVAGVLSLEDGLKLIAARSQLMQSLPAGGEMVAVYASEETIRAITELYTDKVAIAALNGPENTVISGEAQTVGSICASLEAAGITTKKLQTSHAFHSPLMEPILAQFREVAATVNYATPQIEIISNLTGEQLTSQEISPDYWCQHLRRPVQFAKSIKTLNAKGYEVFVEIGAKPTLLGMGRNCLSEQVGVWLPSLRPGVSDWQQMLQSLAGLYVRGVEVDWVGFDRDNNRKRVALPTYPFQRQRYWVENTKVTIDKIVKLSTNRDQFRQTHPLLGRRLNSPLKLKEIQFSSQISQNSPAYLQHHRVYQKVIVPASAYIEMALAAGAAVLKSDDLVLEDIVIQQALMLDDEQEKTIQLILTPDENSAYSFQIFSLTEESEDQQTVWTLHVSGKVFKADQCSQSSPENWESFITQDTQEISPINLYQEFRSRGIDYGESFQAIEKLWHKQGEAISQIRLPLALTATATEYKLHPVLLDASFQVLGAILANDHGTDAYLPVKIERLQFAYRPSINLWSSAQINPVKNSNSGVLEGNLCLYSEDGQVIAQLKGLQLIRASREALLRTTEESWHNWFYQVEWRPLVRVGTKQLPPDYLSAPIEIDAHLRSEVAELMAQKNLEAYGELLRGLEALSIEYVLSALSTMGWEFQLGQHFSTAFIAQQLGVVSQHWRLLERLLMMLVEVGVVQSIDSMWEVVRVPHKPNPEKQLSQLALEYPDAVAELTLLQRCASNLAQVLRGECNPLELLFPQGDLTTATQLYQDSPGAQVMNTLVQKVVKKALERLPSSRRVRVLEIGAGTGGTTSYILPVLPAHLTEYVFTDLSPKFSTAAQQKFRDYPFVRYEVLDIEQNIEPQGFEFHQYDIIVAANVLHATKDLRTSLEHVQQLLTPNGMLVLLEGTTRQRWLDLIFGLTEGWWRFGDLDLRPDYPLLATSQWQEVLQQMGFQQVVTIPSTQKSQQVISQQAVIVAQTSSEPRWAISQPKNWLIMADSNGVGQRLATQLRSQAQACTLVFKGKEYEQLGSQEFKIDPTKPEDFKQLLAAVGANQSLHGVVNCWSLDAVTAQALTSDNLRIASQEICGSTLHLVQGIVQAGFSQLPRLWLVTRGAQSVASTNSQVPGVAQSPLWGMGKVIALEHPELNCVRVDLDPEAVGDEVQDLFEEIWSKDAEDQVAFRNHVRYVARLAPYQKTEDSVVENRLEIPQNEPYRLEISSRGTLENLTLQATTRRKPNPGEVEIRVMVTGLNFLDVLDALGVLPFERGWFGGECAGEIVAIGEGVEGFEIADAVVAIAFDSFSQYVTVNAAMVAHKPETLSFEEAATIPINFLTAYYALHHLAKISAHDRILIHAAAGGTGMAAVQLAQQAGAEVFATASPSKWEFLKSLGVKHTMNSRTLDFASEVMAITKEQGVNIVLNSLTSKEFIPKSLSVLSTQGRFLEMAKRGVWDANEILKARSDVSYFLIDLVQLCQQEPTLIQSMLRHIMQQFESGNLKPLPQKVFPIHNVVDAFRYMQQAKHIGKIVVTHYPEIVEKTAQLPQAFCEDSTYLITGGTGGLGLLVARWMVQKGARHLVLVSRSGASSSISSQLKELESAGAQVIVAKADVSDIEQVTEVLSKIEQSLPPLRGIIHSVGVLDDGILQQLSWERFASVMAPKVQGAWHLHALTQNLPLDFFVLFSSAASLLGSPGQANHSAANTFLDALAYYRRSIALPGLSINWGAVTEIGAAAKRQAGEWVKTKGVGTIAPQQVLEVLEEELFNQSSVQVGVVPINWSQFNEQSARWSFLSDFQQASGQLAQQHSQLVQQHEFFEQLKNATTHEQQTLLMTYVRSQVAKVLGLTNQLDVDKPLNNMGLDSLTALELRNWVQNNFGVDIPIVKFMEGLSVASITAYVSEQLTEVKSTTETSVELAVTSNLDNWIEGRL